MQNSLIILRFEGKKRFKKRMNKLLTVAAEIHTQMLDANVGSDTLQVGSIQQPDVVREELTRAARVTDRTKKEARMISVHVKRLAEWARVRSQMKQAEEGIKSPTDSPTKSVSSSSPQLDKSNLKR